MEIEVDAMKIIINGKAKNVSAKTLEDLLLKCKYEPDKVMASINGGIVERKKYARTILAEGDKVEVFCFVGGG